MLKKKKIDSSKTKTLQKKIDQVKLEAHVDSVKNDRHTDISKELNYHATELRSAIDKTILWAKKEKLGKQTMKLLNTLVDGVGIFLTALVKRKHE
ncbi:MAG: hypothetical protein LBD63_01935 [Mycoplasmataceae bacterium]|jgi:hypothetical protein|nr:hypothetical protein [Mycoplasmataceae bacterium]